MAEVAVKLFTEGWIFLTLNVHSIHAQFLKKKQGNWNFLNFRGLFCVLKTNWILLFAWLQLSWTALHKSKLMAATSKTSPLCSAIAWERGKKNKCNFRSIFQKAEWTIFSLALANSPIKCLINHRHMKQSYRGLFWALNAQLQRVNWWNLKGWALFQRHFPHSWPCLCFVCIFIYAMHVFLYVKWIYLYYAYVYTYWFILCFVSIRYIFLYVLCIYGFIHVIYFIYRN